MTSNDALDFTREPNVTYTDGNLDMKPSPFLVLLGSMIVMVPWPVTTIGACLTLSLFESAIEAFFLLGGATLILLSPRGFLDLPE
jgi:hypothetical protein